MEKNNIYSFDQGKNNLGKHANKTLSKGTPKTIEQFADTLAYAVSAKLGDECAVCIERAPKDGIPCIGLLMEHFTFRCDPFVYLDKIFEGYSNGECTLEECVDVICKGYNKILNDFITEIRKKKII